MEIKITPQTKFHLVAIAHGTEEPCKAYFSGGDGGLLIDNRIVGDMHINEKCEPFSIGQVFSNPEDFIHVFDDSSYINVLTELVTAVRFSNGQGVRFIDYSGAKYVRFAPKIAAMQKALF